MYSFHQIGLQKTASLATVAPGISEALIATAVGLFVAVPATVGYNSFLSAMQTVESELVSFAGVFLNRVQRELNAYSGGKPGRPGSDSVSQRN
jgi:biopolymer transport protein TolQ